MSVFDNIIKKFKKDKVENEVLSQIPKTKIQPEKFDFETNEQSEFLIKKQKQEFAENKVLDLDIVYDLNDIFWVFLETQNDDLNEKLTSLNIKAVPIRVVAVNNEAYDLIDGKKFLIEDVTKEDESFDKNTCDDMTLFSVKVSGARCNYKIKGSGEYYNLKEKELIDSYNAGSPALVGLMKKSFIKTDFSKIFKESSRGFDLKEEAFVTKRDILKLNSGLEKIYKEERIAQNENFNTTYRNDFI